MVVEEAILGPGALLFYHGVGETLVVTVKIQVYSTGDKRQGKAQSRERERGRERERETISRRSTSTWQRRRGSRNGNNNKRQSDRYTLPSLEKARVLIECRGVLSTG